MFLCIYSVVIYEIEQSTHVFVLMIGPIFKFCLRPLKPPDSPCVECRRGRVGGTFAGSALNSLQLATIATSI